VGSGGGCRGDRIGVAPLLFWAKLLLGRFSIRMTGATQPAFNSARLLGEIRSTGAPSAFRTPLWDRGHETSRSLIAESLLAKAASRRRYARDAIAKKQESYELRLHGESVSSLADSADVYSPSTLQVADIQHVLAAIGSSPSGSGDGHIRHGKNVALRSARGTVGFARCLHERVRHQTNQTEYHCANKKPP
jgi:hypothetical protein